MKQDQHIKREAFREKHGTDSLTHGGLSLPRAGRHGYTTVHEWGAWADRAKIYFARHGER